MSQLTRSGILQHMVPVYVTPFECITVEDGVEDEIPELRRMLGLNFPHPIAKFTKADMRNLEHD